MSDTRHPSEYFTQLAQEVIEREPELEFLKRAPITIVYLESSHAKKKYKSTAPHDLEDFKVVIDRYGTDWAKHTDPRVNPVLN